MGSHKAKKEKRSKKEKKERKEKKSKKERKERRHAREAEAAGEGSSSSADDSGSNGRPPASPPSSPEARDAPVSTNDDGNRPGPGGGRSEEHWLLEGAMDRVFGGQPRDDARIDAARRRAEEERARQQRLRERDVSQGGPDGVAAAAPPVGDGGRSWRIKALQRARERAAAEGRPLEEVVAERYGSLKELMAGITEGEGRAAPTMAHKRAAGERREGKAPEEKTGVGSGKMRRPEGAALRTGYGGWRERRGEREGGARGGDGGRGDERGGEGHKEGREERRERGGDERGEGRGERREERRERGGEWRREGRGRGSVAPREALEVAKDMNAFRNDGTFAEQYLERGEGGGGAGGGDEGRRLDGREGRGAERDEDSRDDASGAGRRARENPFLEEARERERLEREARERAPGSNMSAADALRARLMGRGAGASGGGGVAAGRGEPRGGGGGRGREDSSGGGGSVDERGAPRERVVEALPMVDARGVPVPGAFGRAGAGTGHERQGERGVMKRGRVDRFGEDGSRARWFKDDDAANLDDLVRAERFGGRDMDRDFADNVLRNKKYKVATEEDVADWDEGIDMYDKRRGRLTEEEAERRDKDWQVAQTHKMGLMQQRCALCPDSPLRPKHLTVAVATRCFLQLPAAKRMAEGHCQIVLSDHVPSTRLAMDDDAVLQEIRNFKKCLVRMFSDRGKGVLFLESARDVGGFRLHAFIDCVPVPEDVMAEAPAWFKKALNEAESEWSQHAAKSVIDTGAKGGLRNALPSNFPYFYADFAVDKGFLHVVDDEESFDFDVGRNTVASMLGTDPGDAMGRREEGRALQEKLVAEFKRMWAPYDWTTQLA